MLCRRAPNGSRGILEAGEGSACEHDGDLHAFARALDRVLWPDKIELSGRDLDDFCLVGVAPDKASQAFEDKHVCSATTPQR